MSKNKKRRRESVKNFVPAQNRNESAVTVTETHREENSTVANVEAVTEKIPSVSVVIPMFNAAKFIPQTLESLLYQTLTDFEVVVVDDCSTDNSVEVVENFFERFNGRLKLVKLPKNTGTPGLPRNVGIQTARGKYIAFLDSDDLFTKTALEELSTLAEKFQADVVKLHQNFILWRGQKKSVDDSAFTDFNELTNPKNFALQTYQQERLSAPTAESDELAERVKKWVKFSSDSSWATCLHFCRRDFLIANQIFFPPMLTCEDAPFAFKALCLAKTYLNAPNVIYIVRPRAGSVSRDSGIISAETDFRKRFLALSDGFRELEKITDEIDFFRTHPDYRYAVFEWYGSFRISIMLKFYLQNPAFRLNELVKKEFQPDEASFAAYLFNTVNVYRLQLMKLQQEFAALKKQS